MATLASQIETDFTTMNSSPAANELLVVDANASKVTRAAQMSAAKIQQYAGSDADSTDTLASFYGVWYMLSILSSVFQVRLTAAGQQYMLEHRAEIQEFQKQGLQKNARIRSAGRTADDDIDERYGKSS